MLSEIPDEELAATVEVCASEVLWEAGVTEPPVDALAVAEGLGLVVARLSATRAAFTGDGVTLRPGRQA